MKDYDFDYYVTKPWLQEEVGLPDNLSGTLSDLMKEAHEFLCSTNDEGLIEALEVFPELWTLANTYGAIHPRLVTFGWRNGVTVGDRDRHKERVRKIEDFLTRKADPDDNNDWNRGKYEEVASDIAGNGESELQPLGAWNTAKKPITIEEAESTGEELAAVIAEAKKERPHAEAERIGRITRDKEVEAEG